MNSRLTIQDLAALLAERTGKDRNSAEQFLREFIAVISQGVFTDKIAKIKGFGTFKIGLVGKRESIHVNTGERFLIPAHYKFSFLPDKELHELVNKPFSFFETTELNENVDFTDLDVATDLEETEDESVEEDILTPEEEPTLLEKVIEEESDVPEETASEESVEEPRQTPPTNDFSDTYYQFEDEEPSSSSFWIKGLVIVGVLAIVVAGSTFLYLNRSFFLGAAIPTPALSGRSLPNQTTAVVDTLYKAEEKSEIEIEEEIKDTVITEPHATISEPPTKEAEVLAKVKIETGSRLTLISLEYYGSKIFWVYLYDYNKAVIKNPNSIPVGTEILVPAPALYGIDKHSRASIEKAAARQTEILAGNN